MVPQFKWTLFSFTYIYPRSLEIWQVIQQSKKFVCMIQAPGVTPPNTARAPQRITSSVSAVLAFLCSTHFPQVAILFFRDAQFSAPFLAGWDEGCRYWDVTGWRVYRKRTAYHGFTATRRWGPVQAANQGPYENTEKAGCDNGWGGGEFLLKKRWVGTRDSRQRSAEQRDGGALGRKWKEAHLSRQCAGRQPALHSCHVPWPIRSKITCQTFLTYIWLHGFSRQLPHTRTLPFFWPANTSFSHPVKSYWGPVRALLNPMEKLGPVSFSFNK